MLMSLHKRLLSLLPNCSERSARGGNQDSNSDRPIPELGSVTCDTCGTGQGQGDCHLRRHQGGRGWDTGTDSRARGCRTLRRPGCSWRCSAERESGAPGTESGEAADSDLPLLLPRHLCRWFYVLLYVLHCSNVVIRKFSTCKKTWMFQNAPG